MIRIAIVEDDPEYGDFLTALLSEGGHKPHLFATPGRFFDSLIKNPPDLVLMDMQLPGMDGKEIIRVLRSNPDTAKIRVIAMSGRQNKSRDAVNGFTAGADEYLVKPLDTELLMVRIESLLRRVPAERPPEEVLSLGSLKVFLDRRMCEVKGAMVKLTRLEFDLLVYFLGNADRVLPRSVILETVWQGDPAMTTRTVDKHVETLRRKLGAVGKRLQTVIRVGYMLSTS
jgi:two-component system alkaline phosphatase synthesis response regulator PhoP